MTKSNPFFAFKLDEKKAKIKALGGAEITYRELSVKESDAFNLRMISKDYKPSDDGSVPSVNIEEAMAIKYEKVSAMLIDPKMSPEDWNNVDGGARDAIDEILDLVNDAEDEALDEEGN